MFSAFSTNAQDKVLLADNAFLTLAETAKEALTSV
jgi:hypothetical protein